LRHGRTVGHNSDTGERGLKQWGKKVAITAQKRTDKVFKGQIARNTQEVEIVEILELSSKLRLNKQGRGVAAVDVPINNPPVKDGPLMGAAGKNFIFEMTARGSSIRRVIEGTASRYSAAEHFPKQIVDWLEVEFRGAFEAYAGSGAGARRIIQLLTEIKLFNPENGEYEIVRAHPDYRSEGCWYDCVDIDYGGLGAYPARCALFFLWPEMFGGPQATSDNGSLSQGELAALVQPCRRYQTPSQLSRNSLLFSHWTLEHAKTASRGSRGRTREGTREGSVTAIFSCISVASINRRIFAIDPQPGDGGPFFKKSPPSQTSFELIRVEDRQLEWPTRFLSSYQYWE
jgi:hypothetical protein